MQKYIQIIIFLAIASSASAQCFLDRHNTTWHESWASCEVSDSPNPDRSASHWILYNFGDLYRLAESHVWNYNVHGQTDWGMNEVWIDYSFDGITWQTLGAYSFPQATGINHYEGFTGPDFDGVVAQFVLITAQTNHGGTCVGLSELKIDIHDEAVSVDEVSQAHCFAVQTFPNPFSESINIQIQSNCEEKAAYRLTDALGRTIYSQTGLPNGAFSETLDLKDAKYAPGVYFLNVYNGSDQKEYRLVKSSEE